MLHVDCEALTLVDAERMAVVRTEDLSRKASLLERLLGVETADAKAMQGISWDIRFSPDGRWLYATGLESKLDDQGTPCYRGLGLHIIDVDQAQIVAEALAGARIDWVGSPPEARYTPSARARVTGRFQ